MKKIVAVILTILLIFTLFASCAESNNNPPPDASDSGNTALGNAVNNTPDDDADDSEPEEEADSDEWWQSFYWRLTTKIEQIEDFGALQGTPGAYADYYYSVVAWGGGDISKEEADAVTGAYAFTVESVITIDTDEFVDRYVSNLLGGEIEGLDFGADVELAGAYRSGIPYYTDDNGYPITPPIGDNGSYVFPDGKEDESSGGYIQRVSPNWVSTIKNKDGEIVQPKAGSYMMYEALKIEYIGTTYHDMTGTTPEDIWYDLHIFIIIDPSTPGVDMDLGDYNAKIYIHLFTTEHHDVWLEGSGTLTLVELSYD